MRYSVDISHETISAVTDAVGEAVMVWQNHQLDGFYPCSVSRCAAH
ncbi:hypothetical protein KFR76_12470 [Corynebacterium diphtheriae]|nr:hypothetical protein KFR76_12470 [Corynebacterium diphtheriae]